MADCPVPGCIYAEKQWSYAWQLGPFSKEECFTSRRRAPGMHQAKIRGLLRDNEELLIRAKHACHPGTGGLGPNSGTLRIIEWWINAMLTEFGSTISPDSYIGFEMRSHYVFIFLREAGDADAWIEKSVTQRLPIFERAFEHAF